MAGRPRQSNLIQGGEWQVQTVEGHVSHHLIQGWRNHTVEGHVSHPSITSKYGNNF